MKQISAILLLLAISTAALTLDPRASFLDVVGRRAELQHTSDPRLKQAIASAGSCVNSPAVDPPVGPIVIPHHYLSGSHGPINPAEAEATRPYNVFERRVAAGANRYVIYGSATEARCALDALNLWAKAGALLDYDGKANTQSWFQAGWTLGSIAASTSILATNPSLNQEELRTVTRWLDTAAHKLLSWEPPDAPGNNLHYWRALAATAVGVIADDRKLFDFGCNTFREAVGEIDANGAFPREMQRHERSLHYQTFALAPLILIAEFAARQHVDLYAYSAHGRTLRDAIVFFGRAVDNPALLRTYTEDTQDMHFSPSDFAWAEFYLRRFGSTGLPPSITGALQQPTADTRIGGSTTVLAGSARAALSPANAQ